MKPPPPHLLLLFVRFDSRARDLGVSFGASPVAPAADSQLPLGVHSFPGAIVNLAEPPIVSGFLGCFHAGFAIFIRASMRSSLRRQILQVGNLFPDHRPHCDTQIAILEKGF